MEWLLNRLKEPSTWRGLIVLAGIGGLSLSPELKEQIVTVAVGAVCLTEMFRKEKTANVETKDQPRTTTTDSTNTDYIRQ